MSLKPDPTKQAQEAIFKRKTAKKIHLKIFFSDITVSRTNFKKNVRLGLQLDSKESFDISIKIILSE